MSWFRTNLNANSRAGCLKWALLFLLFTVTSVIAYLAVSLYLPLLSFSRNPDPQARNLDGSAAGETLQPTTRAVGRVGQGGPASSTVSTITPTPTEGAGLGQLEPTLSPSPEVSLPTPDPWTGDTRVNILILGLDSADWDSADRAGPPRSDTLIVLSIDPVTKSAGMLSIPRDMYVDIPGMVRPNRINTAHRFGELYHLPGGGPGLAMRTVEGVLNIPLHYYVRVDFRAFERFIDELGGVELDIPKEIKVDPTGPDNTVVLKPGIQILDGPTALAYARNRYTAGGDFDRARRQQQVILAIRDQVLRLDTLPQLVSRAPELYEALSAGVQTNLTLQRVIRLAWLAKEIDSEDIRTGVIGSKELIASVSESGNTVYQPNPDRIRALVASLFPSSSPALSLQEGMLSEEARVSIVDQTGVPERAERVARYLEAQGFQVTGMTVGEERAEVTHIIDYTGKPYTMRFLAVLMGVTTAQIDTDYTPGSQSDIVILLGTDWIYRKLD